MCAKGGRSNRVEVEIGVDIFQDIGRDGRDRTSEPIEFPSFKKLPGGHFVGEDADMNLL